MKAIRATWALPIIIVICVLGMLALRGAAEALPSTTEASRPTTQADGLPAAGTDDKLSVTQGSVTIAGRKIAYDATAGTLKLKDDAGKTANFFFVAYTQRPAGEPATRPITFVFNGGPGAAAVWLHLGALGPQRVKLGEHGQAPAPPHGLIDNPQSWLDLTDLVFIDPVGTGYSRPVDGKAADWWSVEEDVSSVGNFIRVFLTRYQRWGSPKFLAGESYGTTRAAALSDYLLERLGIDVNGIVLISTVLNFQVLSPGDGNDLPYALYLPSYAAIHEYYRVYEPGNGPVLRLDKVENFAMNDYLTALAEGGSLTPEHRAIIAKQLAEYTGLPLDFILKSNLRISPWAFRKQLLNDQRKVLGRFDARVTGPDTDPASPHETYDPSLSSYLPIYQSTFTDYVRRTLKFDCDLNYEVLNPGVHWDFGGGGQGYLDVTSDLRGAMQKNPHLKLLVASAHYDLATPFAGTDYQIHHLDIDGQLHDRIRQTYYDSGHMIYQDQPSLLKFKQDVGEFYGGKER